MREKAGPGWQREGARALRNRVAMASTRPAQGGNTGEKKIGRVEGKEQRHGSRLPARPLWLGCGSGSSRAGQMPSRERKK